MAYLLAIPAVVIPVMLLVGAVRGRVKVNSCCSVAPENDMRLREHS
jgi:hypothetical protein